MKLLTVRHATTYHYARPVTFGEHRLMLRPRDSHDLRLVDAELAVSPPAALRWVHDVFGNSVAFADFAGEAADLSIISTLRLQRFALPRPVFPVAPEAEFYPFIYSASDRTDLGRLLERHHPDLHGAVEAWAQSFVTQRPMPTLTLLQNMNAAIRQTFTYRERYEEGTQSPEETLALRSGTCRDFALLLIEAVRSLGFAARFVSGYLYDPSLDSGTGPVMQGAGATHAWADIYLPGAGWVEYDPTNGLIAGENLIRVAVTRDPSQAIPVSGTFRGSRSDFVGMDVSVSVTAEEI